MRSRDNSAAYDRHSGAAEGSGAHGVACLLKLSPGALLPTTAHHLRLRRFVLMTLPGSDDLMALAAEAAGIVGRPIVRPVDRWVKLNGIRFHYLDWGNDQRPHVLLLHGGGLTAHTWDMVALILHDRYHLLALDQRGHGDTDWTPEDQLDLDDQDMMLEDIRQFIESLGFEHLCLVGMSLGGINTIRYAARHPERLDAVAIVDVAAEAMSEGQIEMERFRQATETLARFEDFLDRARAFMPHRPVAHLRYSLTHSLKQTDDGWTWKQDLRRRSTAGLDEAAMKARWEKSGAALWQDLTSLPMPCILFRGAESKILAADVAERTVAAMQNARLVVIPGATHNVHSDNPVDFAAALDAFLTDILPNH